MAFYTTNADFNFDAHMLPDCCENSANEGSDDVDPHKSETYLHFLTCIIINGVIIILADNLLINKLN